jgi:hypothetical protein
MEPRPIPPEMLEAYRRTLYRVVGPPGFVLRVDEPSPELKALLAPSPGGAAFLTAWNPGSRRSDVDENRSADRRLRGDLGSGGWVVLPALGEDPDGVWEVEEGHLVLGIDRERAEALGRSYGQNAILWAGKDGVPRLVLLR